MHIVAVLFRCPIRERIANIGVLIVPDVIAMRLSAVRKDDGDDLRIKYPRARRSAKSKRHKQVPLRQAHGRIGGTVFHVSLGGGVTKGISMTFMEREKDGALKMIIATDVKYPI